MPRERRTKMVNSGVFLVHLKSFDPKKMPFFEKMAPEFDLSSQFFNLAKKGLFGPLRSPELLVRKKILIFFRFFKSSYYVI